MKKSATKWIIFAAVCVVIGMILCGLAWAAAVLLDKSLSTEEYIERIYEIPEDFSRIDFEADASDIIIRPSQDGKCSLHTKGSEKDYFDVRVLGDTLEITEKDSRKWYERISMLAWFDSQSVLYLPKNEYLKLKLKTGSGDISLPEGFLFGNGRIKTSSGDVNVCASFEAKAYSSTQEYSGALEVRSGSGDVSVIGGECTLLDISSSSGELTLRNVSGYNITLKTSSGDAELEKTAARGTMKVKTSSGDIELLNCDGGELDLRSSSGDVEGSLVSGKMFDAQSASGRVSVPQNTAGGGICRVHTSSGDIRLTVK